MKIYDTHSDVFSNLFDRYTKGEKDIFEKYHIEDLTKGEVFNMIFFKDIFFTFSVSIK